MKLFIDSADINEIREANSLGVIDGVTTNPSLVSKTGKDFKTVIREILAEVDGPINLEVISLQADGMVAEGRELAKISENVVVKIPMTTEGLKAVKILSGEGIKTNVTLVFSANQALLAAKAGATYVSPFVGRLDDISHNGMEIVAQILEIFTNYGYDTEVIVASIRNPLHALESARMGADVATVPFSVIGQLAKHPLTDIGIERFLKDWEKVPKK
ncbi:MAG: fructose-6-phosphate aldolase [Nitrospinae bacterium]|nr:fructose-6-phosphate aldolase [Nitrospinota bacterium]